MPGIVVHTDMRDYGRWMSRLGSRFGPALQRGTVSGAARCITVLQRRTREAPPANPGGRGSGGAVNTAEYLRSWKWSALTIGAMVFNAAVHAAIIEAGRRAGGRMPPLDLIARWAQRRLGLSEVEARRRAFLIARSIQARGLRARHVMGGGVPEMIDVVHAEQRRELDAAMEGR